jgi:UDP-glucose 4-epimerase
MSKPTKTGRHGYSVRQTIEAVHRVSRRNFAVQVSERRPGDIMTMIADTSRICATLDWIPQYDNLDTIAAHALAWEEKLLHERRRTGGVGLTRCHRRGI